MTCERCEDIHKGQRTGEHRDPCDCECHSPLSLGRPKSWMQG